MKLGGGSILLDYWILKILQVFEISRGQKTLFFQKRGVKPQCKKFYIFLYFLLKASLTTDLHLTEKPVTNKAGDSHEAMSHDTTTKRF